MNSHNIPRKTSVPVFKSTRLLDQLREQIRRLHYSLRTEEAYVYWVKNFIRFQCAGITLMTRLFNVLSSRRCNRH